MSDWPPGGFDPYGDRLEAILIGLRVQYKDFPVNGKPSRPPWLTCTLNYLRVKNVEIYAVVVFFFTCSNGRQNRLASLRRGEEFQSIKHMILRLIGIDQNHR